MCERYNIMLGFYNTKGHKVAQLYLNLKKNIMSLVTIIITLIVVGILLWLINSYIPMDGKIKRILNIVVVIVLVIWLLKAFGLIDSLKGLKI